MKKTISHACLVLLTLTLATGVALATTITAGNGTLSFTVTTVATQCVNHLQQTTTYDTNTFSGFSYTVSGTTTPLSGKDVDVFVLGIGGWSCPASTDPPISWTVNGYLITFTPLATTGTATVVPASYPGFINPKYVVWASAMRPRAPLVMRNIRISLQLVTPARLPVHFQMMWALAFQ